MINIHDVLNLIPGIDIRLDVKCDYFLILDNDPQCEGPSLSSPGDTTPLTV